MTLGEGLMTGAGLGECLGVIFGIGGTELAACQKKCVLHCYCVFRFHKYTEFMSYARKKADDEIYLYAKLAMNPSITKL